MAKKITFRKVQRIPIMRMTKAEAKVFFAACLNPTPPTPEMIALFKEARAWFDNPIL